MSSSQPANSGLIESRWWSTRSAPARRDPFNGSVVRVPERADPVRRSAQGVAVDLFALDIVAVHPAAGEEEEFAGLHRSDLLAGVLDDDAGALYSRQLPVAGGGKGAGHVVVNRAEGPVLMDREAGHRIDVVRVVLDVLEGPQQIAVGVELVGLDDVVEVREVVDEGAAIDHATELQVVFEAFSWRGQGGGAD